MAVQRERAGRRDAQSAARLLFCFSTCTVISDKEVHLRRSPVYEPTLNLNMNV
jgi:hypothetical protein